MRILFDTNILLDLLLKREPYYDSVVQLTSFVETKRIEGWLCANSIATVQYLLTEALDEKQAAGHLASILSMYLVSDLNQTVFTKVVGSDYSDYTQALTVQSAILANVDGILSRNQEKFNNSPLPVYSPSQLLVLFNSMEMKI